MRSTLKKAAAALVGVAALAVGGSAIANAASSGGGTTTTTTSPPSPPPRPSFPAHGSAAHEDAEKPVTGADAAKAQAAAVKSLGGGTAGDVTTDFTGRGYEVAVTKSDGSKVEVHLDGSFGVMQFPGHGGPPPPGAPPPSGSPPPVFG